MNCIKKITLTVWMVLLSGLSVACSSPFARKAEEPFRFADWEVPAEGNTGDHVPLFAAELCVVSGEDGYSKDEVDSEAGLIFGVNSKEVLYSKNAFEQLSPASTTKIMTALVACRYADPEDIVTVTDAAKITESGATLCGIKTGDQLTMRQLLYGLLLPSGNDAGAAIAVHMSGSIEAFADLMNREAKRIGATGSSFKNPHGLTAEGHYTTAYDLYLIMNEAMKYPLFREVAGTVKYEASYQDKDGKPVTKTWEGTNWYMLGKTQTPEGVTVTASKTGTTKAAGYCLVMASEDSAEETYISIILKAGSRDGLYRNMSHLISKIVK